MQGSLDQWLNEQLEERKTSGRYRQRRLNNAFHPELMPDGALDFAGNDYLGLSRDQRVIDASVSMLKKVGTGATASPLVGGQFDIHQQLEEKIASWMNRPAALLFPSGFQANLGVLDALSDRSTRTFHDRLNHASLLDGTRLSGARLERYRHLDIQHLKERLSAHTEDVRKLVVSDAVFSMEGDIAPLQDLAATCEQHNAWLVIDDAHGVGVLGENGAGTVAESQLNVDQAPIVIGTLSKALGSQGAFVAGSHALIETLIQNARPYAFSTGLAPSLAAAASTAISICMNEPERRATLNRNINHFKEVAHSAGLSLLPSRTPIQAIVLGDEQTTMSVARKLASQKISVGAIRPPTVPKGHSRLRITINATHSLSQIDLLVETIRHILPSGN